MKFLFWRILVCDLLSNNTDSTNCRLLYTRILWNVPKSPLFLQNTKVVVYNSLISIFTYLQRLSKYSRNPYFHYFWSFFGMTEEYFDPLFSNDRYVVLYTDIYGFLSPLLFFLSYLPSIIATCRLDPLIVLSSCTPTRSNLLIDTSFLSLVSSISSILSSLLFCETNILL